MGEGIYRCLGALEGPFFVHVGLGSRMPSSGGARRARRTKSGAQRAARGARRKGRGARVTGRGARVTGRGACSARRAPVLAGFLRAFECHSSHVKYEAFYLMRVTRSEEQGSARRERLATWFEE